MRLVPDRSVMLAPGCCFVCEGTPPDGQWAVDTLKEFTPGFPSAVAGRKYVCESCVTGLANTAGFVSDAQVAAANERAELAEARLAAVQAHIASTVEAFSAPAVADVADRAPAVVVAEARKVDAKRKPKVEPVADDTTE